jgi:hypothetical protein
MSIRCGTCKGRHESVAEVRACSGAQPATQAAEEGVYRVGSRIFRVVTKAGKSHAVAEEYVRGAYLYARGWVFRLQPSQRLTLEEAAAWGRAEVRCIRCATRLETEESRAAGIGPKCRTMI